MAPFNYASKSVTPAEARLIAHVCGDGYLCLYRNKRSLADLAAHSRKNAYRDIFLVGYCNTEKSLLAEFRRDVFDVYGLKAQMQRGNTLTIRSKRVYERILSFGGGSSRKWFIQKSIFKSSKVRRAWLRAFFDDEAHVDVSRNRICVNSVNNVGLHQVQNLLRIVGVTKTKFYGPYHYKTFSSDRLTIFKDSIKRYAQRVGFLHPKKILDLDRIVVELG